MTTDMEITLIELGLVLVFALVITLSRRIDKTQTTNHQSHETTPGE